MFNFRFFPGVDFTKINLDWIMKKIGLLEAGQSAVEEAVEQATAAAETATEAAETATEAAESAVEQIETVVDTANEAKQIAQTANTNANTALTTAQSVSGTASQALTTAGNALNQADLARTEAIYNNRVKVWENSTPTNAFTPQTVAIDLSDYDYVFVECGATNSTAGLLNTSNVIIRVGCNSTIFRIGPRAGSDARITHFFRTVAVNNAGVTFGAGSYIIVSDTTTSTDNAQMIPKFIYGIKTSD